MKIYLALFLSFAISFSLPLSLLAHQNCWHCKSHNQVAAGQLITLEKFLDAMLVETITESEAMHMPPSDVVVLLHSELANSADSKKVFLVRSELSEKIANVIMLGFVFRAAEDKSSQLDLVMDAMSGLKQAPSRVSEAFFSAWLQAAEYVLDKNYRKDKRLEIQHFVADLISNLRRDSYNFIQIKGADFTRFTFGSGVLAATIFTAVVAATFPPYTLTTEFLESLVLGPLHAYCQFFFLIYILYVYEPLKTFLRDNLSVGRRVVEAIKIKAESPIARVYSSWFAARISKENAARLFLHSTEQLSLKRNEFRKLYPPDGDLQVALAQSSYWPHLYQAYLGEGSGEKIDWARYLEGLTSDSAIRSQFKDAFGGYRLLTDLLSLHAKDIFRKSKISSLSYHRYERQIGKVEAQIARLENWIMVVGSDILESNEVVEQFQQSLAGIDNTLRALFLDSDRFYEDPSVLKSLTVNVNNLETSLMKAANRIAICKKVLRE